MVRLPATPKCRLYRRASVIRVCVMPSFIRLLRTLFHGVSLGDELVGECGFACNCGSLPVGHKLLITRSMRSIRSELTKRNEDERPRHKKESATQFLALCCLGICLGIGAVRSFGLVIAWAKMNRMNSGILPQVVLWIVWILQRLLEALAFGGMVFVFCYLWLSMLFDAATKQTLGVLRPLSNPIECIITPILYVILFVTRCGVTSRGLRLSVVKKKVILFVVQILLIVVQVFQLLAFCAICGLVASVGFSLLTQRVPYEFLIHSALQVLGSVFFVLILGSKK